MMGEELGSLAPGKKADMIIVEKIDGGFPAVTVVLVDGRTIMTTDYRDHNARLAIIGHLAIPFRESLL